MQEQVKLNHNGQIVLPKRVREYWDVKVGDEFEFTEKGVLLKTKKIDIGKSLDKYLGIFGSVNVKIKKKVLANLG